MIVGRWFERRSVNVPVFFSQKSERKHTIHIQKIRTNGLSRSSARFCSFLATLESAWPSTGPIWLQKVHRRIVATDDDSIGSGAFCPNPSSESGGGNEALSSSSAMSRSDRATVPVPELGEAAFLADPGLRASVALAAFLLPFPAFRSRFSRASGATSLPLLLPAWYVVGLPK